MTIYTVILSEKDPENSYKFISRELALKFFESVRWGGFPEAVLWEEVAIDEDCLDAVLAEIGVR